MPKTRPPYPMGTTGRLPRRPAAPLTGVVHDPKVELGTGTGWRDRKQENGGHANQSIQRVFNGRLRQAGNGAVRRAPACVLKPCLFLCLANVERTRMARRTLPRCLRASDHAATDGSLDGRRLRTNQPVTRSELDACGFVRRSLIIWDKGHIVIGRGHYHWRHESCWYTVKKGAQAHWKGDRKASTLWEIDNPLKFETGHSAQKPVECMQRAIHNHKGDVYDPFVGSGTTIIAGEQEGRSVYASGSAPSRSRSTVFGFGRVTAHDPVLPEHPEIACARDRVIRRLMDVVRVRLAGRCRQRQYVVEREDVQVVQP